MILAFPYRESFNRTRAEWKDRDAAASMIATVRETMPAARIVMLSDIDTQAGLRVDEIRRSKIVHGKWQVCIADFMSKMDGDVLLVEPTVVIQRSLEPLFRVGADIVLTSRQKNDKAPTLFKLGVVASSNPELWHEVRDRVIAMPAGILEPIEVALHDLWMEEQSGRGKWKFAVVNCDPYNYMPDDDGDTKNKWVLRRAGARRESVSVA